jgi:HEAT repeat protein
MARKRLSFLLLAVGFLYVATYPVQELHGAKTQDELIQLLSSPDAKTVASALLDLERDYPLSTKAFPRMKELLRDGRPRVRRKAARVLGVLHAPVDEENIRDICALLKAADEGEIVDGLKALRGLKAQSAIPEILPLLSHRDEHVVRDSCRTLAVLGDQDLIRSIEPLLESKNNSIRKDAQDAISTLREKSQSSL